MLIASACLKSIEAEFDAHEDINKHNQRRVSLAGQKRDPVTVENADSNSARVAIRSCGNSDCFLIFMAAVVQW